MRSSRRIALVLTGALTLSGYVWQAGDPRLSNRLDRDTRVAVDAIIDAARKAGVPTEPLVDRALEGASKRATGRMIIAVVRIVPSSASRITVHVRRRRDAATAIAANTPSAADSVAVARPA